MVRKAFFTAEGKEDDKCEMERHFCSEANFRIIGFPLSSREAMPPRMA